MATQMQQNAPPGYNELMKSQEAARQAAGQQQPGYVVYPQTAPQGFYPMPAMQPMQQVQAVQQPPHPGPSDFLILALVTMIVCGLLNLTSLFFGVPALVFAAMSMHNRTTTKNFVNAKKYSDMAIGLIVSCIIYTLVWAVILAGVCTYYGSGGGRYYYYG